MKTYQLVPKKLGIFFLKMNIYLDVKESHEKLLFRKKKDVYMLHSVCWPGGRAFRKILSQCNAIRLGCYPRCFSLIVICH